MSHYIPLFHMAVIMYPFPYTDVGLINFFSWKRPLVSTWCHQMETFSALLAFCVGISLVTREFPAQRPVTWSFDVFFDLHPNKRLSKQLWGWWFKTSSCLLWRNCVETFATQLKIKSPCQFCLSSGTLQRAYKVYLCLDLQPHLQIFNPSLNFWGLGVAHLNFNLIT